ncbi:hypothetical protein PybrP1_012319 [[Pythium] brassicae (nom. inval.)]|nr:hypothetical protein PybrP1_012319 [[Pythium] brassicae (nom. inval.)]
MFLGSIQIVRICARGTGAARFERPNGFSAPPPLTAVEASPSCSSLAAAALRNSGEIVIAGAPLIGRIAITVYPLVMAVPYGYIVTELSFAFPTLESGVEEYWIKLVVAVVLTLPALAGTKITARVNPFRGKSASSASARCRGGGNDDNGDSSVVSGGASSRPHTVQMVASKHMKQELFARICEAPLEIPHYLDADAASLISLLLHREPEKRLGSRGAAESKEPGDMSNFDKEFTELPVTGTPMSRSSTGSALPQSMFTGFTYEAPDMSFGTDTSYSKIDVSSTPYI